MGDYVSFECVHIADADQNDPNERQAIAYADIDGYPADENAEGTVICRVWLMYAKEGNYPTYLVDWHHNGYRMNESVMEIVNQAKKDLEKYKEDITERLWNKAYERYKLKWMLDHNHTLTDLLDALTEIQKDTETLSSNVAFEDFELDIGFRGELWVCKEEFQESEGQDLDYMKELLDGAEYRLWHGLIYKSK